MWKDPIVEEIHAIRADIDASFGGDMHKYVEYIRARERNHAERLVQPPAQQAANPPTLSRDS